MNKRAGYWPAQFFCFPYLLLGKDSNHEWSCLSVFLWLCLHNSLCLQYDLVLYDTMSNGFIIVMLSYWYVVEFYGPIQYHDQPSLIITKSCKKVGLNATWLYKLHYTRIHTKTGFYFIVTFRCFPIACALWWRFLMIQWLWRSTSGMMMRDQSPIRDICPTWTDSFWTRWASCAQYWQFSCWKWNNAIYGRPQERHWRLMWVRLDIPLLMSFWLAVGILTGTQHLNAKEGFFTGHLVVL